MELENLNLSELSLEQTKEISGGLTTYEIAILLPLRDSRKARRGLIDKWM